MKVAIIHYWLINQRGGEKVLESLCEIFPNADIFTHVYDESKFYDSIISRHNVYTSFINKLPFSKKFYQYYLPLMPYALENLDLDEYDLIISSESGPAKGVITNPHAIHICYCHSPMRYAWDMHSMYSQGFGLLKKILFSFFIHHIRRWDQLNSTQVDYFVANSKFIASRIKKFYSRDCEIINPPVNISKFNISYLDDGYYLFVGQLVKYKNVELLINTFNINKKNLIIVGDGEEFKNLKKLIKSNNIKMTGKQDFYSLRDYFSRCKCLIYPGIEDFGITAVEAMACGKPVIGYGKGGILDTVIDGVTGKLFYEKTPDSLNNCINEFEQHFSLDPLIIRKHAEKFSKNSFKQKIKNLLLSLDIKN